MGASTNKLERTKQRVVALTQGEKWLSGVGIGLEQGKPAVVVMVREGHREDAEAKLSELGEQEPIVLKEVGTIRKQSSRSGVTPRRAQPQRASLEELRQLAAARHAAGDDS